MSDTIEKDPLDCDVSSKELTKFPLLQDGKLARFEVRGPKIEKSKDQTKDMLVCKCVTTEEHNSTEGDKLHAGFPVTHRIILTPSEGVDGKQGRAEKDIAKDISALFQATKITGINMRAFLNNPNDYIAQLEGKLFDAKVRLNPEKNGFPANNSLSPIPAA